jgi:hyperosmotically inducible periplasmic protein
VKDDAVQSVKHIEGVTAVNNEIEVLPLSPFDNQIRRATYRAIYGYPALQRYAEGVVPAIHIIVKDGHVTLKGVVATEMDKQMAFMRANGVPNVFSVDNDLEVKS